MSVFENQEHGYLGLDIDGESDAVEAIKITVSNIALLAQIVLGIYAFSSMRQHDEIQIKLLLRICFVVSLLCACLYDIAYTLVVVYCDSNSHIDDIKSNRMLQIFFFIQTMSLGLFFQSLLVTFILRLHATFKQSIYRMSPLLISLFAVINIFLFLPYLIIGILLCYVDFTKYLQLASILMYLFLALYLIGSVLAVYCFVSNISRLALELDPAEPLSPDQSVRLNQHQEELSNLAAKYIMLFGIAMASTILSWFIVQFAVNVDSGLRYSFAAIDLTLNLFCMYLQFAFAKQHYHFCCGCCDKWFRRVIDGKTKQMVRKHSAAMDATQLASNMPICTSSLSMSCTSSSAEIVIGSPTVKS